MKEVGVRELKRRLSAYLDQVGEGEPFWVTRRGKTIAALVPAGNVKSLQPLLNLVRENKAAWSGGKPSGLSDPVKLPGKALSDIVLEDRR